MSTVDFATIFSRATGQPAPYGYQCRLACGPEADPKNLATLTSGATCQSQLIEIPTGLGKTAAVVLAWLWNRLLQPDAKARASWPRRLVYCLPMRTLVEQTHDEICKWISRLGEQNLITGKKPRVVILMGGEELDGEAKDWDLFPEEEAILVGTQDMLISRALNRGYGMSRYRWPMHYALLNNDCLWILDETQLMGVTVETSAQLDAFRHVKGIGTFGPCPTWWMSATLDTAQLATVDHPPPLNGWPREALTELDRQIPSVDSRFKAVKRLNTAPMALSAATKAGYAKALANLIAERHQPDTLTLVILNRVSRAQDVYNQLRKLKKGVLKNPPGLIHSRFRPVDRAKSNAALTADGDRIVIATQAVEAGVDVSARLLITELAPWSSLVQRFGRCNRAGNMANAEILWLEIQPKDDKDEVSLPYDATALRLAREALSALSDASPENLSHIVAAAPKIVRPILRRKDLFELFDTTPDLCGQDLDVSRYIRDGEDQDVQFYWRDIPGDGLGANEPPPAHEELCRVSIAEASKFLKSAKVTAWSWDPLQEKWVEIRQPRVGAIYLLSTTSGGYSDEEGWTGDSKSKVTPHPPKDGVMERYGADNRTYSGAWQTLAEHTKQVVAHATRLAVCLNFERAFAEALRVAALWHDIGKAHFIFQGMLGRDDGILWAKSNHCGGIPKRDGEKVIGFRHELASALAWLIESTPESPDRDLVAYLIASHHGRIRLSIRSLPNESPLPPEPERLYARGVWDGDHLPEIKLDELQLPPTKLDLSFMRMGEGANGASWLSRMIKIRDELGPFRLAYLESVLRASDAIASSGKIPGIIH